MPELIEVRFKGNRKDLYTWEQAAQLAIGDAVVVEAERGLDLGVVSAVGEAARNLFRDGQAMLQRIVDEKLLTAKAVVGFWPANAIGDDIELYADDSRQDVRAVVHTLRQQDEKPPGRPNRALADFIAPKQTGLADYIGGFAVTTGLGEDEHIKRFEADKDGYSAILLRALADRIVETTDYTVHDLRQAVERHYAGGDADRPMLITVVTFGYKFGAPYDLVKWVAEHGKLPVPNFSAGGIATPADASLVMQLGAEACFVGSGIFKSEDPAKRAKAIVKATTHYNDAKIVAECCEDLGEAMRGLDVAKLKPEELLQTRGW